MHCLLYCFVILTSLNCRFQKQHFSITLSIHNSVSSTRDYPLIFALINAIFKRRLFNHASVVNVFLKLKAELGFIFTPSCLYEQATTLASSFHLISGSCIAVSFCLLSRRYKIWCIAEEKLHFRNESKHGILKALQIRVLCKSK